MKIVFQNLIILLSFVAYNYFCFAKSTVKVGVFVNEDHYIENINWNVIQENLQENIEYQNPEIVALPEAESFSTFKTFCNASSLHDFTAVFGPSHYISSDTIESICANLKIPYILTRWIPANTKENSVTFNVYPEANLFAQGLATIIKSLDWEKFVIIYENEESLSKLQGVLKLQQHVEGNDKNNIIIKQLGSGPDYRPLLKDVLKSLPRRIVLDCHVDKIKEILIQSKEVKLLDDFSTSVFLSSLDAHTLDFSELKVVTNITTIRLWDPNDEFIHRIIRRVYPTIPPEELRVETALQYDAMLLLAKSVNLLIEENPYSEINSGQKSCTTYEVYKDKSGLINQMRQVMVLEGITGPFTLSNGKRDQFTLEVIDTSYRDKPIGIWSSENPEYIKLTRNATEREREFQNRMQNHEFIVSSKIGKPYLMEVEDSTTAYGNAKYRGFSIDLIKEIAKLMNITFKFTLAQNNSPASIVNDLVHRRADLGICDFTITQERSEKIDFSLPFMSLGISILHKETDQEEIDNMYGFMRPFSWTVWIYIITLYLMLSITILFIARLDPDDWENPHPCDQNPQELENIWGIKNCLWLTLGSIMTQGCDILPKGVSSRIATASWWFFSLIMANTHIANLAAFLTMSKKDDSIKNVEDLASQNKVKYGVMTGGSTQSFFQKSNNSLYQKMWATMVNENPSVFEDSNDKGQERVLNTKQGLYAFFMESPQIEYALARDAKCTLRKVGDFLDSKSYGIGIPQGAEYRHQINGAILKLQENGRLGELKTKWWKEEDIEGEPCIRGGADDDENKLSLANVGGVFIVLAVGLAIAFTFAIIEFLWNVHHISVEEHMSYYETLKKEVKFACDLRVTKKRAKVFKSESSSSKSDADIRSTTRTILAGAGSFLNVNASVLNRFGHLDSEEK